VLRTFPAALCCVATVGFGSAVFHRYSFSSVVLAWLFVCVILNLLPAVLLSLFLFFVSPFLGFLVTSLFSCSCCHHLFLSLVHICSEGLTSGISSLGLSGRFAVAFPQHESVSKLMFKCASHGCGLVNHIWESDIAASLDFTLPCLVLNSFSEVLLSCLMLVTG
jgi:hypothetical protein